MSTVVDLSGKRVDGLDPINSEDAVTALKGLIAKIESGEIDGLENWLFIYSKLDSEHPGRVARTYLDSGIDAKTALFEVEAFRWQIMEMWARA